MAASSWICNVDTEWSSLADILLLQTFTVSQMNESGKQTQLDGADAGADFSIVGSSGNK